MCGIVKGTVEEIDASVLTKQFTDFFSIYSQAVLDEFSVYKRDMEKYLKDIAGVYQEYINKTENLFAQITRASLTKDIRNLATRWITGTRNY